MTLLDKNGVAQPDPWLYLGDEEPLVDPQTVVPLERCAEYTERFAMAPVGLRVPGECNIRALAPWLMSARLIVVDFPKSRDGRGFTLAKLLRERHAFAGDIRAAGPLLADQFAMLMQCGFTTVLGTETVPVERWREAASSCSGPARPRTLLEQLSARAGQ